MNMKRFQITNALIMMLAIGLLVACEDFEDESYTMSDVDQRAVIALADTLELSLGMRSASYKLDAPLGLILRHGLVSADTVTMTVDTATAVQLSEVYDGLMSTGAEFTVDETCYLADIREDSLSFHMLNAESAGTYVLYMMHYAAPKLYQNSGGSIDMVEMVSDDMSPELIAGLTEQAFTLEGASYIAPSIKGRYEWELSAGNYLFEIAAMEATTNNSFRIALLQE